MLWALGQIILVLSFRFFSLSCSAPKLHYAIKLQVSSWHKRWDTEILRWQATTVPAYFCLERKSSSKLHWRSINAKRITQTTKGDNKRWRCLVVDSHYISVTRFWLATRTTITKPNSFLILTRHRHLLYVENTNLKENSIARRVPKLSHINAGLKRGGTMAYERSMPAVSRSYSDEHLHPSMSWSSVLDRVPEVSSHVLVLAGRWLTVCLGGGVRMSCGVCHASSVRTQKPLLSRRIWDSSLT